jgi:hypothetical protein
MGQCATVHVIRGTDKITPEAANSISMLNGAEEDDDDDDDDDEDKEEEEEEAEEICKGCLCEGCKCCKYLVQCFKFALCSLLF